MISFQDEFMKTKGKPIQYKDKLVCMVDHFVLPKKRSKIKFKFISTNSEWLQGIEILVKGSIKINNEIVKNGTRIWQNTAPICVEFEANTKDGNLIVSNIWDHGDGVVQKWHNGAAMYFEEIKNGKKYYCNDGHPDDNFNELIFELTIA